MEIDERGAECDGGTSYCEALARLVDFLDYSSPEDHVKRAVVSPVVSRNTVWKTHELLPEHLDSPLLGVDNPCSIQIAILTPHERHTTNGRSLRCDFH